MKSKSAIVELYNQITILKESTSREYKRLAKKFHNRKDEFAKTLSDKQQEILEEVITLCLDMQGQETQEEFVDGFKRGVKLIIETYEDGEDE